MNRGAVRQLESVGCADLAVVVVAPGDDGGDRVADGVVVACELLPRHGVSGPSRVRAGWQTMATSLRT
jgi:hypothetical protein